MTAMASPITGVSMLCSIVYSGSDQRKPQNSASLAFVGVIQRWPVNSPHKGPATRKMFPFDNVIMKISHCSGAHQLHLSMSWSVWLFECLPVNRALSEFSLTHVLAYPCPRICDASGWVFHNKTNHLGPLVGGYHSFQMIANVILFKLFEFG